MKLFARAIFFTALLPLVGYGEDKHDAHKMHETKTDENASGVEALSHDLRRLLSKEMQALQSGMMSMIPAYVSGNWREIEITAGNIKSSYILKQSLTESQVEALHTTLPHGFIEQDQRFHYLAGMLEHAAKNKKPELINFYFSEMNESCVSCHTQFATHRFPALAPQSSKETKEAHTH